MNTAEQDNPEEYWSVQQVADYTGTTQSLWDRLRWGGGGPPYIKMGKARGSLVRYRRSDVDAWMASQLRRSTFDDRDAA